MVVDVVRNKIELLLLPTYTNLDDFTCLSVIYCWYQSILAISMFCLYIGVLAARNS